MKPEHLQGDLRSEVMLILCEEDEEKIISLYQKGVLKFYTVRIILNLIQSNTSPFYKKFRRHSIDISSFRDKPVEDESIEIIEGGGSNKYTSLKTYNTIVSICSQDLTEANEKQLKECLALDEIDNLYWYDREIVRLYLKLGNYRAVESETGIPWESCYKTIKSACKKIKAKVA